MKFIKILLAVVLSLSVLSGCGKTETYEQEIPEESMAEEVLEESAAEETLEEPAVYEGVLEYYFEELHEAASNPATLEIIDEHTIRANLWQSPMYKKEFVEKVAVGDTIVLPDREILIESITVYGSESQGYTYHLNMGMEENHIILLQKNISSGATAVYKDYYPMDSSFWPIYYEAKSVDISEERPFTFMDAGTDNMELYAKGQSFRDLHNGLSNNTLDYINLQNTRVSIGGEFTYTYVMILDNQD